VPDTWIGDRTSWTRRIGRAAELAERNPWAKEVLDFYRRILEFQKEIFASRSDQSSDTEVELRNALDLNEAEAGLQGLVTLVKRYGPAKLADEATRLQDIPSLQFRTYLNQYLASPESASTGTTFFVRTLLQPQAERLAQTRAPKTQAVAGNRCPQCESAPQLTVIRPEGDGGKRMLLCSLCQSEWDFRRILCPACGETNHEKLPRYTADGIPAVRVEGCDTCKSYLKSVDMTVDGLAVPIVDEIASAPLDLWAGEHEYRKIHPNLMGF
jgi:FdhE protein